MAKHSNCLQYQLNQMSQTMLILVKRFQTEAIIIEGEPLAASAGTSKAVCEMQKVKQRLKQVY